MMTGGTTPLGGATKARQVSAAIGDVGMHASALPEAELAGVAVDHQVGTAAEIPIVVTRALEHALIETGRPEVEAHAVLAERVAEAAPLTAERVAGPERLGCGPVSRCLCTRHEWPSQSQGQAQRQQPCSHA